MVKNEVHIAKEETVTSVVPTVMSVKFTCMQSSNVNISSFHYHRDSAF